MGADEAQVRESICQAGRSLFDRGLTAGSSGNISVRINDGWILTPTGASLGRLEAERLSKVGFDGSLLSGEAPSKELPLHAAMYEVRSSARAIVHLHSTYSVAVSMLRSVDPACAIPPLTAYFVMRVGRVPLVPYHMPGDPGVAAEIRALASSHAALLLANHGPVVSGRSLDGAMDAAEELEETAKLFLTLGERPVRALEPDQIAELAEAFGAVW
jgi:ribulose-5-phosphate 4-epimerase/fuculose-1-phosphate aldolase